MAFQIDTNLLDLLPDFYAPIKDYQQIMKAEEYELELLAEFISAIHDNFFVQTMDEGTASQWEQLLGIAVTETQSLDFRRMVVLNRIATRPPFTLTTFYAKLDELIGPGNWEAVMDYDSYTLYIESSAESQDFAVEIAYTIATTKPAHIVYVNRPLVSEVLNLNEAIGSEDFIYYYKLGGWALGRNPFRRKGEEVPRKLASTRSLTDTLITGVSTFVSGDIAAARINDTHVISDIVKSVTGNVLTVTYEVPVGLVNAITKIELIDGSGNALTSSSVYIPVASGTEIRHKITTQEGF